MDDLIHINTIDENNKYLGLETRHPLVTVLDWADLKPQRNDRKCLGIYAIFLKDGYCGDIRYGREYYDYQDGTLVFIAPGQIVGGGDNVESYQPRGRALMFHPDLLFGTSLGQSINDYSFFGYEVNEALHISEEEKRIFINCLDNIKEEIGHALDKHSNTIIASNLELLLNYCRRFYDRQFITRVKVNSDVLSRFNKLLNDYFGSEKPMNLGLPTVKYCADCLCFSPNYFGDLVKKETGKTAQEYISIKISSIAKEQILTTNKTLSEIAYSLGFQHPSHFTAFFKKAVGCTPIEYRT